MIEISDSEDEGPTWGPKAPQKRKAESATSSGITGLQNEKSSLRFAKHRKGRKPESSPSWPCGLPCQFCEKLVSPSDFLAHSRQHTLIPCELCSQMVDPDDFLQHMTHHEKQTPKLMQQAAASASELALLPCEVCGDLFMPSEYSQHLQEHEATAKTEKLSMCTPVTMAARWVEQLRCDAEGHNIFHDCIVNFDLAVSFAERARRDT